MVTALATPLTYEGLIDDLIGIENGLANHLSHFMMSVNRLLLLLAFLLAGRRGWGGGVSTRLHYFIVLLLLSLPPGSFFPRLRVP